MYIIPHITFHVQPIVQLTLISIISPDILRGLYLSPRLWLNLTDLMLPVVDLECPCSSVVQVNEWLEISTLIDYNIAHNCLLQNALNDHLPSHNVSKKMFRSSLLISNTLVSKEP